MAYILEASGPKRPERRRCLFCVQGKATPSAKNLVVATTPLAVVMLNLYPYNVGHVLIAPRKHRAHLADLSEAESAELGSWLARVETALRKEYRPDGLNIGMNLGRDAGAGVLGHLHWHVVPRWSGDTNFMPVTANTKVLPESLDRTYARVKRALAGRTSRPVKRRR